MTEPTRRTEDTLGAVRQAALGLLASLPEQPKRLRIHTAGVTVDLDWRSMPGTFVADPPGIDGSHFVCAPAVGTFYHASDPGQPPFVVPGALVEAGQQVGIVESMKLMLPVEADRAGRLVTLLVADGQPVEYGQRLVELGPAYSQ